MSPTDNLLVTLIVIGEGYHNYHHVFPWDYRAGETTRWFNFTATLIELFAKIGWAYDLKTVSQSVIDRRADRTGDGNRAFTHLGLTAYEGQTSVS